MLVVSDGGVVDDVVGVLGDDIVRQGAVGLAVVGRDANGKGLVGVGNQSAIAKTNQL